MEDNFYVDTYSGIHFDSALVKVAINDISNILEQNKRNDFVLLSAIRQIVKESSHGGFILQGDLSDLKYSWVNNDYTVITILEKCFGFSAKYIERLVRIINKFIVVNSQNDVVLEYILDFLKDLTISKLQELLPLSIEQIKKAFDKKDLTYKSTIKDIREYVKSINGGANKDNKVLEEQPEELEEEITDCSQLIRFKAENFEYMKDIVKEQKKFKDTSECINYLLEYAREHNLF